MIEKITITSRIFKFNGFQEFTDQLTGRKPSIIEAWLDSNIKLTPFFKIHLDNVQTTPDGLLTFMYSVENTIKINPEYSIKHLGMQDINLN